jgi:hypothetical protein
VNVPELSSYRFDLNVLEESTAILENGCLEMINDQFERA